jgi:hypothetical protein
MNYLIKIFLFYFFIPFLFLFFLLCRICRSLYEIFLSSEGSLLSSIGILLGNLQKDTQYRIREKIFETLGKLGVHFVNK